MRTINLVEELTYAGRQDGRVRHVKKSPETITTTTTKEMNRYWPVLP